MGLQQDAWEYLGTHHDREVGSHDVVVAACSSDGDGVGAQPCLGVRLVIILLDPSWLKGGGPLDGPKLAGEGGEAVEVVAGLCVAAGSLWTSVAPAAAVLVVGVGGTMFLVVLVTSLAFGGIALVVTVVDALT